MGYRMHSDIMKVSSESLYESKLVAHVSVTVYTLNDLEHVEPNAFTCAPLVHIETAGCGMAESSEELDGASGMGSAIDGSESKANMGEAQLALAHVKILIAAGVGAKDIAIITPYNAQVCLLKRLMQERYPELEI
ncbi:DNA-binding protein SMUBP-2 [Coemansia sp. S146]|nr:DNA-binding protein SMUBP-2 [Coemansia sp. S146]